MVGISLKDVARHALFLIKQRDISTREPVYAFLKDEVVGERLLIAGHEWDKLSWLGAFCVASEYGGVWDDMKKLLNLFFRAHVKEEDGGLWACGPWYWMQERDHAVQVVMAEAVLTFCEEQEI